MNFNCVICSDLFGPSSDIWATRCGHMFHNLCVRTWIERNPTCPHCRSRTTVHTIYKLYFNVPNTEVIKDDVCTLQHKVDGLQLEILEKNKDVDNYKSKCKRIKSDVSKLRDEVCVLESRCRSSSSTVSALKDQLSYFKSKAKENDCLSDEIGNLRNKLKMYDTVQLVHDENRARIDDMVRNERNTESLALLVCSLKKTLVDSDKKRRDIDAQLAHYKTNDYKQTMEMEKLSSEIERLRHQVDSYKTRLSYRKESIKGNLRDDSSNVKRVLNESPMPLSAYHKFSNKDVVQDSPTVSDIVKDIQDSSSPYLALKSNSVPSVLFDKPSRTTVHRATSSRDSNTSNTNNKLSIFKTATSKHDFVDLTESNCDTGIAAYDGLGGHSRADPFRSHSAHGLVGSSKRAKMMISRSSVSSSKFRRLAPIRRHNK